MNLRTILGLLIVVVAAGAVVAQDVPLYLQDRGAGVATSMFGTYVRRGEWIVYPFFEYYADDDLEYAPEEFGFPGDQDFRGRYRAKEGLLFVAYGLTDDLAIELEAAVIEASLDKSPADTSGVPARIEESGFGDVEGQLRWRWQRETEHRPELFSYAEVVFPHHKEKLLIGTAGWQTKVGTGITRGFRWGTLTARGAIAYDAASSSPLEMGEFAFEYLKRLSPRWRVYAGVEGSEDEMSLITEVQWQFLPRAAIKFNNAFGLTSKATDRAPEIGVVFSIPTRRMR